MTLLQLLKHDIEPEQEEKEPPVQDDGFSTWDDIFSRPPLVPVLDGFLFEHETSILIAKKGVSKSFLITDWQCHIAIGRSWYGHDVQPGHIVSVIAEGAHGAPRRLSAWCLYHGVNEQEMKKHFLFYEKKPLHLLNDTEVSDFIENIKRRLGDTQASLFTVDTLSQCVAGHDENNNGVMSKAIENVDRIRRAVGIRHALIVHHEGHAVTGRGRGASAIEDNIPAIFTMAYCEEQEREREPTIRLHIKNERDEECPPDLTFKRLIVPTTVYDGRGKMLTSCVLVPSTFLTKRDVPTEKALTQSARKLLKALPESGLTHVNWREKVGMATSTFNVALKLLKDRDLVTLVGTTYKKMSSE